MFSNYFKSFALLLSLCLLGNVSAQGTLSYGDISNVSGNDYSVDVTYTNNTGTTFQPTYLQITIGLSGSFSNLGGTLPNNAGWIATQSPSNINFNGSVNTANWDSSVGGENLIGTITFSLATSGCISFQTAPLNLLISSSPFTVRTVSAALTKCIASGVVSLATSTDDLRTRTVTAQPPVGGPIDDSVGGLNDDSYSLCNVPPGAVMLVLPTPEYEKYFMANVTASDITAIIGHILGTAPLNDNYEKVAADINTDTEIDIFDVVGIQRGILGISEADMTASWVYPTTPSLSLVSFPITYETQYSFMDINSNVSLDFTAVKLGDVLAVNPDYDKTLGTKIIEINNTALRSGTHTTVPVFIKEVNNMLVMSMALKYDTDVITLQGLKSGTLAIDPNSDYAIDQERGMLNMILTNLNPNLKLDPSKPAFYLQVKANRNVEGINDFFIITSDKVEGEFFGTSLSKSKNAPAKLELEWTKASVVPSTDFAVLTSANPFKEEIVVSITSEHAQTATFTLFDITGRLVYSGSLKLTEGLSTLNLSQHQISATSGTYILNIQDENGRKAAIKLVKN